MRFVGIDQSYSGFGYCLDGVSLKKTFTSGKYSSPEHRLDRIEHWFRTWFHDEVVDYDSREVGLVAIEGYANAAKFGRELAGELGGTIKKVIYQEWGQPALIVPPTSLKKFVTGKGTAKKNEMLLGVYKQWDESFSDDNQADAFALYKFAEAYYDRYVQQMDVEFIPLFKYQEEALEAVHKKVAA